jgi:hypothetical protein
VLAFTLTKLPKGVFTVKIVATASNKQQTISVRKYLGCNKSKPTTRVRRPQRTR